MENYMQSKVGNVFLAAETARRLGKDGIISVVSNRKVSLCFTHYLTAVVRTECQSWTVENRAPAPRVCHATHDHGGTRPFLCFLDVCVPC